MKFHSAATTMLVAGIAGIAALAASNASELASPSISTSGAATSAVPVPPKELLARMQAALARGELLKDSFYSTASLQRFFGPGYRFTVAPGVGIAKTIYFDDGDDVYVDEHGAPTAMGLHRPCLQRGTILFEGAAAGGKAKASIAIEAMGLAAPGSAFGSDLVQQVLGAPTATVEGVPSAPPAHGQAYRPTPQVSALGHRWLSYQTKANGMLQRMRFRTLGDATIAEIQLFEAQL